jgi:UDP-glucose 4-epimerase
VKILVTGGAGFIGSHVVDAYIEAGHEVIIVDNLSTGKRENVNPRATFFEIDIRSPDLDELLREYGPQVINHHAAQMDVRKSVADPLFDMDVNIRGTLHLLELSRKLDVERFIFACTGGALYGEAERLPVEESHPIRPISPYGVSKRAAELYCLLYRSAWDLPTAVLRYANVYGPRQDAFGEAGVVAIFTMAMLRGRTPTIYGDGSIVRDFVYVQDVVRANLLALERDIVEPVNIGTGAGTSVGQLYELLSEIVGFPGPPRYAPPRAGDVKANILCCRRAEEALGWSASTDMKAGLRLTVESFRAAM